MSNLYGGNFTLAVRMKNYGGDNNCIQNFIREDNIFDWRDKKLTERKYHLVKLYVTGWMVFTLFLEKLGGGGGAGGGWIDLFRDRLVWGLLRCGDFLGLI
jgi:hypothetical protein